MKINEIIKDLVLFDSEKKCYQFLLKVRWDGKPQCPQCQNSNLNYYLKKRKVYKCSACYKQFSVIKGTIFEKTKISLQKWFSIIYIIKMSDEKISSIKISKLFNIKQASAWVILKKIKTCKDKESLKIFKSILEVKKNDFKYFKEKEYNNSKEYITFEELKQIIQAHNIKTKKQFYEFAKSYSKD